MLDAPLPTSGITCAHCDEDIVVCSCAEDITPMTDRERINLLRELRDDFERLSRNPITPHSVDLLDTIRLQIRNLLRSDCERGGLELPQDLHER